MRQRVTLFWGAVIILAVAYLFLRFGIAYLSQVIIGAENPLPAPGALLSIYVVLIVIGLAVYISMNGDNQTAFLRPITAFLRGPETTDTRGDKAFLGARWAVIGLVPLLVGFVVYSQVAPSTGTPTMLRIQHPGLPKKFEDSENPFRGVDEATQAVYLEEGRDLFYINCRPCHGTKANGAGPMARGFRLKPADFTDPGTISTVVEAFAFWRVRTGNPGLPVVSSPWDSAMPKWERDLTDDQIWKILLAEYDIAGVDPRQPE
jgi:mono/diheme cytochrome c family protein|tara:strand:+ start:319 stop:1101 length:783 start_codon:yes stop_codon:yes gene_type:complete